MPEGVPRLVASASGAPASGIETVTGGPVRCMNRVERLVGLLAARRPEPAMTVARSVSDVLDDHVVFEVESIDRMYLNVWQQPVSSLIGRRLVTLATDRGRRL